MELDKKSKSHVNEPFVCKWCKFGKITTRDMTPNNFNVMNSTVKNVQNLSWKVTTHQNILLQKYMSP